MKLLSVVLSIFFLAGCSKTPLTAIDLSAMDKQAAAMKACHEARNVDLSGVSQQAVGYIVMARQFSDALLAVTGNAPCSTTSAFDVQIAEVEAKNKTATAATGEIASFGKFFVGAAAATSILSRTGGDIIGTDNAEINVNSGHTANADSYNSVDATTNANSYNQAPVVE